MQIKLNRAFTHTLNSLPRGRLHKEPILNSCNLPWHHVTVDFNSNILLCNCDGWLPVPVGKVNDFNSFEEIWNSPTAKFLQQNITDKKYTWCAVEHCGVTQKNIRAASYSLNLNLDESCNLSCPSCRREMRMLEQGEEFDSKYLEMQKILKWLENFDKPIKITLSGNGDPLASKIIRPLILDYKPKDNQVFELKTNGLLMKKLLDRSLIRNNIKTFSISIDAATQETYEKVRRPGKWSVLLENLEWLKDNRGDAAVGLYFVVQKENLNDMFLFVDLCKKYGFESHFFPLANWQTWNSEPVANPDAYTIANGTFIDHDVANPGHPDHQTFVHNINELRKIDYQIVLNHYFKKFYNDAG